MAEDLTDQFQRGKDIMFGSSAHDAGGIETRPDTMRHRPELLGAIEQDYAKPSRRRRLSDFQDQNIIPSPVPLILISAAVGACVGVVLALCWFLVFG